MKGPFSIWGVFGLTLWIDLTTLAYYKLKGEKIKRVNPYKPLKEVSVLIPAYKEGIEIEKTIRSVYIENYPIKNVIVCSDNKSPNVKETTERLMREYKKLVYLECPYVSKSKKINYTVNTIGEELGEFIYVRDTRVTGTKDCIEKMMSYFSDEKIAAVTSYGRLSIPKNFLSRSYYYGKAWINELGRYRKDAQQKRSALFVVCGASTIYRKKVLKETPLSYGTKTEDTHYTWKLQINGYKIRVADDAVVSAPEIDGLGLEGIKGQLKQAYRWSAGTIQCIYREGIHLPKHKKLLFTTILPGFMEAVTYSVPLVLLPLAFIFYPNYALGFLIGDTVFSLVGTLAILPRKFIKTVIHYPQIFFFKYLNAAVFLYALIKVSWQALTRNTNEWYNEWTPPETTIAKVKNLKSVAA